MTNDSADQKSRVKQTFNAVSPDYDSGPGAFAHYGRRLVEIIKPAPGAKVLDVASGRGAVLFPAVEAVGRLGKVIGIDLADGMAEKTNAEAESRGFSARVEVMDAENLSFDNESFEYVLCGFGIMFFPDQLGALQQFRRVLSPDGRLGITTWRIGQNVELDPILSALGVKLPPHAPGWITEPEVLSNLLVRGGFNNVRVEADEAEFQISDAEEYWQQARGTGFRRVLDGLDTDVAKRAKEELAKRFEIIRSSDGIKVKMTALIAVADR